MGVMQCDRSMCDNVMCEKMISDGRKEYYICQDCYNDLLNESAWKITDLNRQNVIDNIRYFMHHTRPDRNMDCDIRDTRKHFDDLVVSYCGSNYGEGGFQ